MKKIQLFLAAFMVVVTSAFVALPASPAGAVGALDNVCSSNQDNSVCKKQGAQINSVVGPLVSTLLYIIGFLSVLMIIVGGIFYVTSQGVNSNITRAKNTILYAIIGLLVSFISFAIVKWVIHLF